MQQQSHSSFFTQMVEAYGPSGHRPFTQRNCSETIASSCGAEQLRLPSEMNVRPQAPTDGAHSRNGVISDIQQRLRSIQSGKLNPPPPPLPPSQQQQYHRPPQHFAQQSSVQYEGFGLPNSQSNGQQTQDGFPLAACPSGDLREQSLFPVGVSSPLSHSSAHKELNHAKNNAPCNNSDVSGGNCIKYMNLHPESDNDDILTLQEMAQLRVVEFAVPVEVSAQLEPGGALVRVCEEATVKLFPHHLVLLRPDGVAAVELVIEELYELNEDETKRSLDCIVQLKGSTSRQLIRIVCADETARGAIFKLLSARRTIQEAAKGQ